jgi:hypothetical protein
MFDMRFNLALLGFAVLLNLPTMIGCTPAPDGGDTFTTFGTATATATATAMAMAIRPRRAPPRVTATATATVTLATPIVATASSTLARSVTLAR